jgi:hypothetical protein
MTTGSLQEHAASAADTDAATEALAAALTLFKVVAGGVSAASQEALLAALGAGAMVELRTRLLPEPLLELVVEPVGGEEVILAQIVPTLEGPVPGRQ